MKKYDLKYCPSSVLQFLSVALFAGGWVWLISTVLQALRLPSIPEANNGLYTAVMLIVFFLMIIVIPGALIIFVFIRLPNARATVEISDTAVKIQQKNKSYTFDFQEIGNITYDYGLEPSQFKRRSANVLSIYFLDSKKYNRTSFELRAPGGIKEGREFIVFYTELMEKYNLRL